MHLIMPQSAQTVWRRPHFTLGGANGQVAQVGRARLLQLPRGTGNPDSLWTFLVQGDAAPADDSCAAAASAPALTGTASIYSLPVGYLRRAILQSMVAKTPKRECWRELDTKARRPATFKWRHRFGGHGEESRSSAQGDSGGEAILFRNGSL